jgi:hypothetical protein
LGVRVVRLSSVRCPALLPYIPLICCAFAMTMTDDDDRTAAYNDFVRDSSKLGAL